MTVRIATASAVDWTAGADWNVTPTVVTAWIGDNFVAESDAISGLERLENEEVYRMPAGTQISLTLTPSNGAAGDMDGAVVALFNTARATNQLTFRLHSSDPGSNHTGNELNSSNANGYSRQNVAWTVSSS